MLIPSCVIYRRLNITSLSRRVNANSQLAVQWIHVVAKLIKKGEC